MRINTKKGAIELSINTIVVIVLALSMLILGFVLIQNIFDGAKYNIQQINDKSKDEINKLFVDDTIKAVVYLDNNGAEIKQGKPFGIAWALQTNGKSQTFNWEVEVKDDRVMDKCGVSAEEAELWVSTGGSGDVGLASGDKHHDVINFNIPENSVSDISSCLIRYRIVITQEDGSPYKTVSFDVDVK